MLAHTCCGCLLMLFKVMYFNDILKAPDILICLFAEDTNIFLQQKLCKITFMVSKTLSL